MQNSHSVSMLMFGTLAAVVVIVGIMLIRFMRKRENRHSMDGERERNIDEIRRDGPGDA